MQTLGKPEAAHAANPTSRFSRGWSLFPPGWLTLRRCLMSIVFMAMFPMFVLAIVNHVRSLHERRQERYFHACQIAEATAGSITQVVTGVRQILIALSHSEAVKKKDLPACNAYFAELQLDTEACGNIGLILPDGFAVASAVPIKEKVYLGDRSWFQRVQQKRVFTAGEYQIGRISGKATVNFTLPLPDQKTAPAAVFVALSLEKLQRCISAIKIPRGAVIFCTDRNGIELARNPASIPFEGIQARSWRLYQTLKGEQADFLETAGLDGVERLIRIQPVADSDGGLFVGVGLSKELEMAAIWETFLLQILALTCVTLLAGLCAGVVAERAVIGQVKLLVKAARQTAEGDNEQTVEVKTRTQELRQLSFAYNDMVSALRRYRLHLENLVRERTAELWSKADELKAEIEVRKRTEAELLAVNSELQASIERVKQLDGLLPICAGCKKIRDDKGYWNNVESYIQKHSEATFTHGMCPDCARIYFPDIKA